MMSKTDGNLQVLVGCNEQYSVLETIFNKMEKRDAILTLVECGRPKILGNLIQKRLQ